MIEKKFIKFCNFVLLKLIQMKTKTLLLLLFFSASIIAQKNQTELNKALKQLKQYNDVYFKFKIKNKTDLQTLPKFISIDSRNGKLIKAYVPKKYFQKLLDLHIPFEVIDKTSSKSLSMATTVSQMQNWDKYPTYDVYVQMMQNFATNYPNITQLDTIGYSQNNRLILALKITDNPNADEDEPAFFYSAQMHGDELIGQIVMLRLIDYLLSSYTTNNSIKKLVNNIEIWINPLANPDGLYAGGNQTVANATRYFSNSVDPNRNFPGISDPHPDGEAYTQETNDMIQFMETHHFNLSANLHSGAEVVNFPWDEWDSSTNAHADHAWWVMVASDYANMAKSNSPYGYFQDVTTSGITEGGDWYIVQGGRQDYMTYHKHGREMTLELSSSKMLDAEDLPDYWEYNYRSLLNYMQQSLYGLRGIITDSETGEPIVAKIEIQGHDKDNSFVYSDLPIGNYHRYLKNGSYNVTYSKNNYYSQTYNVTITNNHTTIQNIALVPINADINELTKNDILKIYPNPINSDTDLHVKIQKNISQLKIGVFNMLGEQLYNITKNDLQENDLFVIETTGLSKGMYILNIYAGNQHTYQKLIIN